MNFEIKKANLDNLQDIQNLNLELFKKEQGEYDKAYNLDWTFGEVGTDYFKNKIKVTASSKNVGAIKFYEKQGFVSYSTTLELNL